MITTHHRDHPCKHALGSETLYLARGSAEDLSGNQCIVLVDILLSQDNTLQLSDFGKTSASVPCENCDGSGGWIDVSDEDERGPIHDWFDCPVCQGTGEYEPYPRLITLEDFEECFGWH